MKNIQLNHSQHKPKNIKYPICFLIHDFISPQNTGSLFRIADALGVKKIFLTGKSITPPNSKIKKTSRSTEKYVSYSYKKNPIKLIEKLKSEGYKIISLEITSSSIDIKDIILSKTDKVCLILGSEKTGICTELLDISDITVHIPMQGKNSSMNVASACAIAAYGIIKKMY